jgi:hypothetical protein
LIDNDAGIAIVLNSGCCVVDHNVLKDNRFFGLIVVDGEHTISNTQIRGGNVGLLAAAFSADTVATLDRVLIVGSTTPTQETFSRCDSRGSLCAKISSSRTICKFDK